MPTTKRRTPATAPARQAFRAAALLQYDPEEDTLTGLPARPGTRRPLVRAQRLG
jgi:hypothetical protein